MEMVKSTFKLTQRTFPLAKRSVSSISNNEKEKENCKHKNLMIFSVSIYHQMYKNRLLPIAFALIHGTNAEKCVFQVLHLHLFMCTSKRRKNGEIQNLYNNNKTLKIANCYGFS